MKFDATLNLCMPPFKFCGEGGAPDCVAGIDLLRFFGGVRTLLRPSPYSAKKNALLLCMLQPQEAFLYECPIFRAQ
jgi:hypothetical protein